MVRAKVPARKGDGRPGPPDRYPKDPAKYADPSNWKYPVHSPFHARAARRYFNDPRNRAKYDEDEQAYIDRKIDAALRRFGVAAAREPTEEPPPSPAAVAAMSRDDLLRVLVGTSRLKSARAIPYDLVTFLENRGGRMEARVKQYRTLVDFTARVVEHDCEDWRKNRARGKLLCKHLGRLFLNLREDQAAGLLRKLLVERDAWDFR
ncbi:MAG TPA: DUF6582 domain-containing protein [Thermoplasmata archaeon]|nr:DUF6582 domain-containing protein [Thermoplasmata archaeon]